MRAIVPFVCLCACLIPAARAQSFTLSVVNGTAVTPVGASYNFGNVPPGVGVSASFQLQNTSTAAAKLTLLTLDGPTAFSISGVPSLPETLNPQATVTFTVSFQATVAGGYSAFLIADGINALLTAAVVPGLSYQVQTPSGTQNLGSTGAINFGTVNLGSTSSVQFVGSNPTTQVVKVPAITVSNSGSSSDFSLVNQVSGTSVQPGGQVQFSVQFQPSAAGTRSGTITIGSNSYALAGTGNALTLPQPHVNILLSQAQSAEPGTITVTFASPAESSGSGTVTLAFQSAISGAVDSSIVFASGVQSAPFTFSAGDVQATFGSSQSVGFQTGTTAGTIQFTAQIGNLSDQQSVPIPKSTVSFTQIQVNVSTGSLTLEITGFDNTRSAGPISFAFYDAAGDLIAPGAISANATAAFTQYFSGSQGGSFTLSATFPVTGDVSQITYAQAAFSNSAGTSTTTRTSLSLP